MDEIISRAGGTTFAEISRANFRPIQVLVPHKAVLDAYIKRVGRFYERIISNVQESQALAAIRDSLLPRLLSGEIRLREAKKAVERLGA
jgi:type I restriction enzyme S subunit